VIHCYNCRGKQANVLKAIFRGTFGAQNVLLFLYMSLASHHLVNTKNSACTKKEHEKSYRPPW
jgi:hypothetical protein